MLNISKQFDYAIQLIVALSKLKKNELLSLRQFSEKSNISFLFLQRIARALKEVGIIDSVRGMKGGYYLTKDPHKVNLLEVYEAVEGKYGMTKCMNGKGCAHSKQCSARPVFDKVNTSVEKALLSTYVLN